MSVRDVLQNLTESDEVYRHLSLLVVLGTVSLGSVNITRPADLENMRIVPGVSPCMSFFSDGEQWKGTFVRRLK